MWVAVLFRNRENKRPMLNEIHIENLIAPLLVWYAKNKRSLPWRGIDDPYRIWVSEIMLQQTRVEAVIPYYERFLDALPTIGDLAECDEDRLLKLWEGLGYYSRVRNMQKAAKKIVDEHGGAMPRTYEEVVALPGIGPYTAGAITSIAFGLPQPAVDGNVLRILARVSDDATDILSAEMKNKVTKALHEAMPQDCPGIFNQAMMDLGACVCLPNGTPKCEDCPWRPQCLACKRGTADALPVRVKKTKRRTEERTVLLVMDGERVLLHKRPAKGLLAGLYELPNIAGNLSENDAVEAVRQMSLDPMHIEVLENAKHLFSHIEWRMKGYLVRVADAGAFSYGKDYFLIEKETLRKDFSVPSAFAAYLKYI